MYQYFFYMNTVSLLLQIMQTTGKYARTGADFAISMEIFAEMYICRGWRHRLLRHNPITCIINVQIRGYEATLLQDKISIRM